MPLPASQRLALHCSSVFPKGVIRAWRCPLSPPIASSSTSFASFSGATSMSERQRLSRASIAILSGFFLAGAWYYNSSVPFLGDHYLSFPSCATINKKVSSVAAEAEGTRIVALDHDNLYTGTLPAGGKISKEVENNNGRKVVDMLTPEEATRKLRRNEESYLVSRGCGVWRYDVVQIPSNDPIEDDHAEKIIEVPGTVAPPADGRQDSDWIFWGIFDGHSGWTTSAKLREVLIGFVARELNQIYKSASSDLAVKVPSPDSIDLAIKKGFLRLDNEIVHESVERLFKNPSKQVAAVALAPAMSGSCALLSFYESRSKILRVAVTGDSRAVLGRRSKNGKWIATQLSEDQTGDNVDEEKRMRAEHPGEEHVIRNGRVLGGLQPTRAFGDAFYKWSQETQLKIKSQFFGRTPSQLLKSPPYVTAEPIITTTQIQPENDDFVVMATDGLWEMLTNEEVVGLVGKWLDDNQRDKKQNDKAWFSWGGKQKSMLPIEAVKEEASPGGQRQPIRVRQWGVNSKDGDRFVCEDRNAATHLVRNALGGKNTDMLCALLTLPSPYSRRYRDDLTVEVVFFGDGDGAKSGNVTINEDATAKIPTLVAQQDGVKAKL